VFDRFRAFTSRQQIAAIAIGVAVIGALLAVLWLSVFRTTYQPLFVQLRTADAATIVADLDHRKIPYRLADGGTTILVPSDMVDTTRLAVMSGDLPLKGTVGFELFNKSDMGITDFAEKINYQRALQGELERTIMTLDGVDTARVHLSLGEDRIFRDDRIPPKASVTVRMAKGAVLSENSAQGVRRLVAAAVPNLDIANVVILDEQGNVVSAAPQVAAASETASPLSEEKRGIEEYYEARIREALAAGHLTTTIGVSVFVNVAEADQTGASGLSGWTPGTRNFPLDVTLSPAVALDPAAQDFIRTMVSGAIGTNAAQDDVISFGLAAPVEQSSPGETVRAPVATSPSLAPSMLMPPGDEEHDGLMEAVVTLGVVLVVLLAIVFAAWRLKRPRRMNERERAEFAARLRAVVERGTGHAESHP
jgi:flagellar M-ring protein FliF